MNAFCVRDCQLRIKPAKQTPSIASMYILLFLKWEIQAQGNIFVYINKYIIKNIYNKELHQDSLMYLQQTKALHLFFPSKTCQTNTRTRFSALQTFCFFGLETISGSQFLPQDENKQISQTLSLCFIDILWPHPVSFKRNKWNKHFNIYIPVRNFVLKFTFETLPTSWNDAIIRR
jgi:hypothetical protein